jgi:hypothetical protein
MSFIFKYKVKQEKETNREKETSREKETLLKKSSCCGAISDAWVPSYPSLMLAPSLESLSEVSTSLESFSESKCKSK